MSYYPEYSYEGFHTLKRRLSKATNLLCLVCKYLEQKQILGEIVKESQAVDLEQFWRKERAAYAKREAKEAAKRKTLAQKEAQKLRLERLKESGRSKLTQDEAIALGLEKKTTTKADKSKKPKKRVSKDQWSGY